jgi:hypothetical protein
MPLHTQQRIPPENRNNIIIREPSASSEKKVGGLSVLTKGLSDERKNENY